MIKLNEVTSLFFLFYLFMFSNQVTASDIELENIHHEVSITLSSLVESSGRDNLIDLLQYGSFNQANLSQTGQNNNISLDQVGYKNESDINQLGYNNTVDIVQFGNSNHIQVTQVGNENLVQLNQFGDTSFSVEQIADNAIIRITQY